MFKRFYIIFPLYAVLLIGFFLNADPNGGAYLDYQNHIRLITDLKDNVFNTLLKYDQYATRHSPLLYVFISFFYKLNLADGLIRFLNVHICLVLILIFYKCISIKYKNINSNFIFPISCLIILSPSFWSLAIWPDSRIYGLIFFTLSIYYFLKFENENKNNFRNSIKCILSYSISSYFSPNFAIFSIFYFYFFYKKYNFSRELIYIVLINLALSIPAFIYIFSLDTIFIFQTAVPAGEVKLNEIFNLSNKVLIISSIILFYALPFLLTGSIKYKFFNLKLNLLTLLILLVCIFYFNYDVNLTGGGIFFKFSDFIFKNNYLFFIICFFAINFILNLIKIDFKNFLLILLLFLSNPQYTIYHKYYDPLMLILFILLLSTNLNIRNFFNNRSILIFYLYAMTFLVFNFIK
tara:strand:+ start:5564 stop:6784 length:1221 start_codon:yes stop_codon:yes gene_type:complete